MGITAIWIGPVFKQVKTDLNSYHGYGVQDFLDVDPRFGPREEYKSLVQKAHDMGLYVIQDIICNHSGDVFCYEGDPNPSWKWDDSLQRAVVYPVKGFYDADHRPDTTLPFRKVDASRFPDAAIWPAEFQDGEAIFTREGKINNWDRDPEYLDGDFYNLKDFRLGASSPDQFVATPALKTLVECYKYWIAFADLDAFRLDTVKHMGWGPTRYFCNAIHEYAMSIGKNNFMIVGEITGGNESKYDTVTQTGLNAALGITDLQQALWNLPKGNWSPQAYFDQFRNATYLRQGSHAWLRDKLVTMIDDHDQVWRGDFKGRFCSDAIGSKMIFPAIALNMTTLGIACIYYGSEQSFDGSGGSGLPGHGADQWIRECMFGGKFGAFRSQDRHFFDELGVVYGKISRLAELRRKNLVLTRGRQYLREISGDGVGFGLPEKFPGGRMESIVAWSRIFNNVEILCAINTDTNGDRTAWVTVDAELNAAGDELVAIFEERPGQNATALRVEKRANRSVVQLTMPPASFAMFKK
ncbi:hypothetical protein, variant [Verruconis gallopava]|nr:hypothetical protein, variant [Verruconis gallopava]KIW06535.1 hypothetical protein, variant [Verruconis gallopava]